MSGLPLLAFAFVLSGDAQVAAGTGEESRFRFDAWRCQSEVHSRWRSGDGRVVAEEELAFEGERWVRYRLQRSTIAQDVVATREGDTLRLVIRNGESRKQITLATTQTVLAGPLLVDHLAEKLPRLRAGKSVEFDYLVPDHGMVLRLRATLEGGARSAESRVRVEAASLLMRAFVPNTKLVFDDSGVLRSMTGRLLPQLGDVTKPKSLDGVLRVRAVNVSGETSSMQSTCNRPTLS
ncbi:MAG: hypothetical protein FJ173_02425 [Gammaproteobacteria bacterium]|nr:hypothetical protein [Gammaproteobacteria bacterium]